MRRASFIVRKHLETDIQTFFFYKTIAPKVFKFYMEHDFAPGSQNYKIGLGQISKMAAITKNSKITKSSFSPEPQDIFG